MGGSIGWGMNAAELFSSHTASQNLERWKICSNQLQMNSNMQHDGPGV